MTLLELRDALAKATGPDRVLDSRIAIAIRDRPPGKLNSWLDDFPSWQVHSPGRVAAEKGGVHWEVPTFTASIDAAVTLVPEGCSWTLRFRSHWNSAVHVGEDWATRYPDKHSANIMKMANRGLYDIHESAAAATVPLALCLARIKYEIARAAAEKQ